MWESFQHSVCCTLYLKTYCHSLTTHINSFHLCSDHLSEVKKSAGPRPTICGFEPIIFYSCKDRRFVGSNLSFSIPVKTDEPVETVQVRTWIKWEVKGPSDRCYCIILIQHWLPLLILLTLDYVIWKIQDRFSALRSVFCSVWTEHTHPGWL
jgi:hypothetical protein